MIIIVFFALHATTTFAADVSIYPINKGYIDETLEIALTLNTDGVLINSANLALHYDNELVEFSGYKSDGSVITLWLDTPHAKNGIISMKGIIPGGVSGLYNPDKKQISSIPLVTLLFTPKKSGVAQFYFTQTQILKNDGRGTELAHSEQSADVTIEEKIATTTSKTPKEGSDSTPPEAFTVTFLESSLLSRTPSLIMFQAHDTESGIKEYQLYDGTKIWETVESPVPIHKSIFSRTVTVRAIDFSGNTQDASVQIPGLVSLQYFLISLIILILSCIWIYRVLKYK